MTTFSSAFYNKVEDHNADGSTLKYVNTQQSEHINNYSANAYEIPNNHGCTITTNIPMGDNNTQFARIGNDGKLLEFNMKMAMAGAQAFVDGNKTASNMASLLAMSILDKVVDSSYCFDNLEHFRTFLKKFEIS